MRRWFIFSILIIAAFLYYAFLPRTATSAMAASQVFETLVLDAGHGGEDGGAVSVAGRREADVNLAVCLRAKSLAALLGIPCATTREEDRSLHTVTGSIAQRKVSDIKNRVAFVESVDRPLLVSIHQNHFPQGKYHGAQVFYAATDGSEELAQGMQTILRDTLDSTNHRKIKRSAGVYLMENVHCPAVLVECGFLSNAAEEEKLHDPNYQIKIAAAIIAAVTQYKSEAKGIDKI